MPTEKTAPDLAEQLVQARAKIAELESANARLRGEQIRPEPASLHPPSLMLENITDAFVAVDREFRYTWVNSESERLSRMSREQLIGRSIWEIFPFMIGTTFEQKSRQALAEGNPLEFDNYNASWDRWFYNKVYPTKEGGLAIYWRDITDQKRAQADLRRQASLLNQVHDSIISTDLKGNITHWNRGAEKMFGYKAEEILGQHVSLLYFEEDRAQVDSAVLEPLLRDGQSEVELRNRRKSGEECYIRLSLSLLRDEANHPYGMLGVSIDITAQRHAERALRESEERYRCLTDAMPQVVYVTNAEGKTEMVNHYWEEYSGLSADQCFELNWLSCVHPDDVAGHLTEWMECLRTGKRFERIYRLRNAGGEYRWHLSRALPLRGADGNIAQWVGTSTDIHERKSAAEAVKISEERFQLAFRAVQGVIYDWDLRTGSAHRAGDMEDLFGVSAEKAEPNFEWYKKRIHPDDLARSTSNLELAAPDQQWFEADYRVRHDDGSWVDVYDRSYIVRDENGTPVRVVGNGQNITRRKQLERELAETSKQLKFQADILATTNDAVIAIDENEVVTWCNAGAERMYRVYGSEVIGKPLSATYTYKWLNPEDNDRALSDLAEHGSWKGENIHVRRDGTQMIVNSTVNVLSPEFGGGLVAVIRDISEQKQAEIEVRQHAAQLARANEDLLHFAYAASHDLRAPLRAVTSLSQLLARTYTARLDEEGIEILTWIVSAGARMNAMLDGLLQFATLAGRATEFCDKVPLEKAVAAALENLRSAIEESGAVISCDSLPTVTADSLQMAQLFQNLIGNSIKYRKPDNRPEVHISVQRSGEEWVIAVRDKGIGFETQYAERIFGLFQRLHSTEFAGTGVGLAICKRIVERHGGRIWAAAAPDEGAVFSFSIPVSR